MKGQEAAVFVNNMQAVIFESHFPSSGKGGVIVKLGERNIIRFKGLLVKPLFKDEFDIIDCKSHHRISANYYRLDSKNDRWPQGEFCKAISRRKINANDYFVSVQLFNQRGTHGTHLTGSLGLMYNAHDEYNYDFIFFKYVCQICDLIDLIDLVDLIDLISNILGGLPFSVADF